MEPKQKENFKRAASILSFMLAVSIAINFIQFYNTEPVFTKKNTLTKQNEELKNKARRAVSEIERYKGISEKLDKVVSEANMKLAEQEVKINRAISEKNRALNENRELGSELEEIKEKYFNMIDSLLIEQQLNASLQQALQDLENKIEMLNVKIGFASLLIMDNLKATPLHERKGHGEVQKRTALARRTDVVNICFDIMENHVAQKGKHNVFVRIVDPLGNVLPNPEGGSVSFKDPETGKTVKASYAESIDYQNHRSHQCLRWHSPTEMAVGVYLVEAYSEKQKLGTTTFTLR